MLWLVSSRSTGLRPRSAREKKNLEAPKDAKCPRRRCNLVLGSCLVRGPLLALTLRLHPREKERARPATSTSVPLGARAKVNPPGAPSSKRYRERSLCCPWAGCARVAHLRSGSVLCRGRWMIIWAAVLGGGIEFAFCPATFWNPPSEPLNISECYLHLADRKPRDFHAPQRSNARWHRSRFAELSKLKKKKKSAETKLREIPSRKCPKSFAKKTRTSA